MSKATYLKYRIAAALAVLATLLIVGTASAHTRIVKGDAVFVLGWLDEPPVAGLKNAAWVQISTATDNKPITGAEATLTAQIQYGGKSYDLILLPLAGQPGTYVGSFIPTRRGTYTLKLGGTLNNQPIDVSSEIEEVGSADSLAFPEPVNADIQQSLDDLHSELNTARAFGLAGLVVGAISLALAGILFGRLRK